MRIQLFLILIVLISSIGCDSAHDMPDLDHTRVRECTSSIGVDTTSEPTYRAVRGALLGTRFKSLEELKSVVNISYNHPDSATTVWVRHCSNGVEVISILESGISQDDLRKVRDSNIFDRIVFIFNSPYAIRNRADITRSYILTRRTPSWFGEGDIAFFDLAKATVDSINTADLAFRHIKDSTEKGYLNSFNHITAQAFVTSCFSERMADYIADAHERFRHPELISGDFTPEQVKDLAEGPVDNYVDIINNEWGQELGKELGKKYNISSKTYWTPDLMANYLNDLQEYYSWAFQIGFRPFRSEDQIVIKFTTKINIIMNKESNAVIWGIKWSK